jgi:hypothetical protein
VTGTTARRRGHGEDAIYFDAAKNPPGSPRHLSHDDRKEVTPRNRHALTMSHAELQCGHRSKNSDCNRYHEYARSRRPRTGKVLGSFPVLPAAIQRPAPTAAALPSKPPTSQSVTSPQVPKRAFSRRYARLRSPSANGNAGHIGACSALLSPPAPGA